MRGVWNDSSLEADRKAYLMQHIMASRCNPCTFWLAAVAARYAACHICEACGTTAASRQTARLTSCSTSWPLGAVLPCTSQLPEAAASALPAAVSDALQSAASARACRTLMAHGHIQCWQRLAFTACTLVWEFTSSCVQVQSWPSSRSRASTLCLLCCRTAQLHAPTTMLSNPSWAVRTTAGGEPLYLSIFCLLYGCQGYASLTSWQASHRGIWA